MELAWTDDAITQTMYNETLESLIRKTPISEMNPMQLNALNEKVVKAEKCLLDIKLDNKNKPVWNYMTGVFHPILTRLNDISYEIVKRKAVLDKELELSNGTTCNGSCGRGCIGCGR